MTHHIVVLGAGYAGLGAAQQLARRSEGDTTITLVNARHGFVERVRLHQLAAGHSIRSVPLRDLVSGDGIELVIARVTRVDAGRRQVHLDATPVTLAYDTLVYALGSGPRASAVPGADEYGLSIAAATHAEQARHRIRGVAEQEGVVTVVGGGLTGIEAAAELVETYASLHVRLVTTGELGAWLSTRGQQHLRNGLDRLGVRVHERTTVIRVEADAIVTGSGRLASDAVLWAGGFDVPQLAAEAGVTVDDHGRMVVDDTLRSVSHPDIYGVGDAAAAHAIGGEARMSCQTGLPMGQQVARIIAQRLSGKTPPPARIRYVWTNISLGRRDGITQFSRADDRPLPLVLTGRAAAWFKERVTRGTVFVLRSRRFSKPQLPGR